MRSLKAKHFAWIASEIELMRDDVNMAEGHVAVTMAIQKKEILSFVHLLCSHVVGIILMHLGD